MSTVNIIIVGAGNRGRGYADYCKHLPDKAKIVGVAEPNEFRRNKMVEEHNIAHNMIFDGWQSLAEMEKMADVVIVATQDHMHAEPAIAFADLGYHILLEKPMAPSLEDCQNIVEAVNRNGVFFAVCHVMRYTPYTIKFKELLEQNIIGDIVSMQHLEPVGYWHQAHSFVRGNWRNEAESSFMLLAKSCHDVDWITYIMQDKAVSVSSFGNLKHFKKSEKPEGASNNCLDCGVERDCPYSSKKIYLERFLEKDQKDWPLTILTDDVSEENVLKALKDGPYGRCVYECDNDVVDHQVVNISFANGRTASFTMTAFTEAGHRHTRLFGSRGQLTGDGKTITHHNFVNDEITTYDTEKTDGSILGGHGGGDYGLMDSFIKAIAEGNANMILSGPEATLHSHHLTFAAEEARKKNQVVNL